MDVNLQVNQVNQAQNNSVATTRPNKTTTAEEQSRVADLMYALVDQNGRVVRDISSNEALDETIQKINESILNINRRIEYNVHQDTNRIMVRVINSTTEEVIRDLPCESRLDALATLKEALGINVNESL